MESLKKIDVYIMNKKVFFESEIEFFDFSGACVATTTTSPIDNNDEPQTEYTPGSDSGDDSGDD